MLGWVITCHDDKAQDMLQRLEKARPFGPVSGGEFLARSQLEHAKPYDVPCPACHRLRRGRDIPDRYGRAAPYRVASLMSHKHPQCEVISGISYSLLERMISSRESMSSSAFRDCIVALGGPEVSSLWHQQQKNPPSC